MALFRKRTADDIVAPLTNMIEQLKDHRNNSLDEASRLRSQVDGHVAEATQAQSHLDKLSAIFGK